LFGEAFEYQQAVPFFSLFMATLRADPPVGDAEVLRRLGGAADLGYWVVHDLADAIHAAAAQTPLAILLEDIHWADNGTLLALRSLANAGPNAPVLWVLTARTGAGGPAVQETLSVLQRADATVVRVAAMSPDAVADMVQDVVRARADTSLLNLAAKAHGNPFLVNELVGGLDEEGRLSVTGGLATASGQMLPRRLRTGMQQRLDLLSAGAGEVVRVAAVLPDRFSASLLAAMLGRQPASLLSALEEALRADLFVEDDDQLRFRHDLLREATRQSLPQSLRRAMERQSASIMLSLGAAPAEVATQLARSAEPGDREAISALRQAAHSVDHADASAAADLSKRALELLPADDGERGSLVAETVELLNRARRYEEAEELAVAALSAAASTEEEAEIRLRLRVVTWHSTQRRLEENRRALQLGDVSEVTRARHLAWLAYNLALHDPHGHQRAAADEAVEAAASSGDLEATIVADVALACVDSGDGYVGRALRRHEELYARTRTSDATAARELAAPHYAHLLAAVGRVDDAVARVADGKAQARRERNAIALNMWAVFGGLAHLAAGRLSAARAEVESLPPSHPTSVTEADMLRMVILAEVAARAAAAEDAGTELARTDRGGEAVDRLNAAFDTYMRHEAVADARRVGRQLRGLGVERRVVSHARAKAGWDSLTDAELKVVNLIAAGATNRAVAD